MEYTEIATIGGILIVIWLYFLARRTYRKGVRGACTGPKNRHMYDHITSLGKLAKWNDSSWPAILFSKTLVKRCFQAQAGRFVHFVSEKNFDDFIDELGNDGLSACFDNLKKQSIVEIKDVFLRMVVQVQSTSPYIDMVQAVASGKTWFMTPSDASGYLKRAHTGIVRLMFLVGTVPRDLVVLYEGIIELYNKEKLSLYEKSISEGSQSGTIKSLEELLERMISQGATFKKVTEFHKDVHSRIQITNLVEKLNEIRNVA